MSTTSTLDLWPDDIHGDILTPIAILRIQASALSRKTGGLVRAETRTDINQDRLEHSLDVIAPALNNYQITLLKAWHDPENIYPAIVKSRGLLPEKPQKLLIHPLPTSYAQAALAIMGVASNGPELAPDERAASTQEEFISLIGEILKSGWVRSLTQSLIARSNDALAEKKERNGSSENSPSTPKE